MILNNIGEDYDSKVFASVGNEVLKSIVAQYDAGQLVTMREKVSNEIRDQLKNRTREFGIILDDIAITDLNFSRDFAASIEAK